MPPGERNALGLSIVSASVTEWSYSVCACVRVLKSGQSKVKRPEFHTLCRDSGGLHILEVSWSRVIGSGLTLTKKQRKTENITFRSSH